MFQQLRIRNFKNWEGEAPRAVDLAPITLFLGKNSAGKSSLLQPLLLLKQTVEAADRRLHLNLGGQDKESIDFGSYRDLVARHDTNRTLGIGFSFGPALVGRVLRAPGPPSPPDETARYDFVDYDVDYRPDTHGAPVVQTLQYHFDGKRFGAVRTDQGEYTIRSPKLPQGMLISSHNLDGSPAYEGPERSVAFSASQVAFMGDDGARAQDLGLALTRELERVSHLGPLRARPARFYSWDRQTPTTIGGRGKLTIQALIAAADKRDPLVESVSEWLKKMDVADRLRVERQGSSEVYEIVVERKGSTDNLLDVGFGVSQVLPVLTLAYFAPRGSTVILEEPEMHLHPSAQGMLAELLVEVSRSRGVQFLVETHSEHLFRRLQSLVADETIPADHCRLYFVERNGGGPELQRLELDAYGRITNWPAGFFADTIDEVERQTRQMLNRLARDAKRG